MVNKKHEVGIMKKLVIKFALSIFIIISFLFSSLTIAYSGLSDSNVRYYTVDTTAGPYKPTTTDITPTSNPTESPTNQPTITPTDSPTKPPPTLQPTTSPIHSPSKTPAVTPRVTPKVTPTATPTAEVNLLPLPSGLMYGSEIICIRTGVELKEKPSSDMILVLLHKYDKLIFIDWNESLVHVRFGNMEGYADPEFLRYNPENIPTATPSKVTSPKPSPTYEPIISPAPTSMPQKTTPTIITDYDKKQNRQGLFEKLSVIPIWFFTLLSVSIISLVIFILIRNKRR